jgi:hypothetical protein
MEFGVWGATINSKCQLRPDFFAGFRLERVLDFPPQPALKPKSPLHLSDGAFWGKKPSLENLCMKNRPAICLFSLIYKKKF